MTLGGRGRAVAAPNCRGIRFLQHLQVNTPVLLRLLFRACMGGACKCNRIPIRNRNGGCSFRRGPVMVLRIHLHPLAAH